MPELVNGRVFTLFPNRRGMEPFGVVLAYVLTRVPEYPKQEGRRSLTQPRISLLPYHHSPPWTIRLKRF